MGALFSQYIKNFCSLKAHPGIFTKKLLTGKKIRPPMGYQRSFVRIFISAPDLTCKV
jgi:hypothetical protein